MKNLVRFACAGLALSVFMMPVARADMPREGEPAPQVQLPAAFAGKLNPAGVPIGTRLTGQVFAVFIITVAACEAKAG